MASDFYQHKIVSYYLLLICNYNIYVYVRSRGHAFKAWCLELVICSTDSITGRERTFDQCKGSVPTNIL